MVGPCLLFISSEPEHVGGWGLNFKSHDPSAGIAFTERNMQKEISMSYLGVEILGYFDYNHGCWGIMGDVVHKTIIFSLMIAHTNFFLHAPFIHSSSSNDCMI